MQERMLFHMPQMFVHFIRSGFCSLILVLRNSQLLEGLKESWHGLIVVCVTSRQNSFTLRQLRYIEGKIALRHVWEFKTVDVFFLFTGGLR